MDININKEKSIENFFNNYKRGYLKNIRIKGI